MCQVAFCIHERRGIHGKVNIIGLDLAKRSFSARRRNGRVVQEVARESSLSPAMRCVVAMEARRAHHWGAIRDLGSFDLAAYVKPQEKRTTADAEAICEVGEPDDHAFYRGQN
jgi:hypothetical protein